MKVVDDELDDAVRELVQLRQRARDGWWKQVARQSKREASVHRLATRRALAELEAHRGQGEGTS